MDIKIKKFKDATTVHFNETRSVTVKDQEDGDFIILFKREKAEDFKKKYFKRPAHYLSEDKQNILSPVKLTREATIALQICLSQHLMDKVY